VQVRIDRGADPAPRARFVARLPGEPERRMIATCVSDRRFILLGNVGLMFIMFTAALEVDLGVFK